MYSLAIMSIVAGFTMLFLNMYLPPRGEIHESVLTAFGIILIFVGSLLGIEMHYSNKLNEFKRTVIETITAMRPDNEEKEEIDHGKDRTNGT